jgi:DNA-binding transcriptional MerR regulator
MSRHERTWQIGELTRATGLTVRTLRYCDQRGLLSPLSRTEGGHRCYTSGDVRHLHRIVALRSPGISLEEIGTLLDSEPDPTGLLGPVMTPVVSELADRAVQNGSGAGVKPNTRQALPRITFRRFSGLR